ncbi:MAG: hypothetical protein AUJ51_00270 [Elusimicrobia bacterium CG1_02_56_21]|nr:MAG: hypothetical protein AUJ51_00270 [Elusimicrobia bacterium CG1_02_56_21]
MKIIYTAAAFLLVLSCPMRAAAAAYGAGFYDTSEYFMGKVAVNVIFVESDGSIDVRTETNGWSDYKKNQVMVGVQNAMSWWEGITAGANLSFVYNNTTVTTGYEPINRASTEEELWIMQVMGKLGYTEPDYGDRVFHYNNDMRAANSADWSFTVFMADSQQDADGEFPDGAFAYAYIGGPFMVMTYNNDSYGIADLDAVAAHETGHIFYALDEYAASGCATTDSAGYRNITNTNCETGGTSFACIMRGDTPPYDSNSICEHTKHMLGWTDINSNSILDLIDLPPTTVLNAFTPDPTSNTSPVYYGMAHSTAAYPNINTYDFSVARTPANITINRIASVEYKIDSGSWLPASPRDGAFDQNVDSFTFTAALPSGSTYVISARARDIFGAYDATPATDSLTVDSGQPQDILYINDGTGSDEDYTRSLTTLSANWGTSWHSSGINRYEYAIGTTPGAVNTVGWTSVGTALSVTKTGLSLSEGVNYYFSVVAYSNAATVSGTTTSDGIKADTISPTAKVQLTSAVPVKTGSFTAKLIVTEANAVSGTPQLGFAASNGFLVPLTMSYLVDSTWTASGYIESYHSTGTAAFYFSAADMAGNTGATVTSGGTFSISPSLTGGSSGTVSNSDGNSVLITSGSYTGTLFVSISTVPAGTISGADGASPDSKKVFSRDLAREFSARDGAGNPVTTFLTPLTITMSYPDADNDGRIDMDLLRESTAWIYYLDPALGRWTPLPGVTRNAAANTLSAELTHFSVYSVRAAGSTAADISSLRAYPNPCDFRTVASLTIDGIPADAAEPRVYIYNEAGELVRSLAPGDGINGLNAASWDGLLEGGAKAASGLYIYLVRTSNYGKGSGKFFILW